MRCCIHRFEYLLAQMMDLHTGVEWISTQQSLLVRFVINWVRYQLYFSQKLVVVNVESVFMSNLTFA